MSAAENSTNSASQNALRVLMEQWGESLAQLLEAMVGERPGVRCRPVTGGIVDTPDAPVLWWKQPFQICPDAVVWVGAPKPTWEHVSTLMLKAAGLESEAAGEAEKTWHEILEQWLSGLARSLSATFGQEVLCTGGEKAPPLEDQRAWTELTLSFAETSLPPMAIAFSPALAALLGPHRAVAPTAVVPMGSSVPELATAVPASRTMELLLDVELPVSISFGRTELPLKDVLKLTTGSILELNRGVNEPVDILVNHCLVARGEVVVVEGNYGVRIRQIVDRQERLRSVR